jgi:hypothetical protein
MVCRTNVVVWYDPSTKDTITVTFVDGAVTGKSATGFSNLSSR